MGGLHTIWTPGAPDVAVLLGAIYALDEPDDTAWLARIVDAVRPSFPGAASVMSCLYRRDAKGALELPAAYPDRDARLLAELVALPAASFVATDTHHAFQVHAHDDKTGAGAAVAAAIPKQIGRLPPELRVAWSKVGAHLRAGARLRLDSADRAALRVAARVVDRVRGRRVDDVEHALAIMSAVADGAWRVHDDFDHNGRRYLIVDDAPVPELDLSPLTRKEARVVCFAALGHTNKSIAFELGVPLSTVGTRMASAMRKLGVSTRAQLVRRACALKK